MALRRTDAAELLAPIAAQAEPGPGDGLVTCCGGEVRCAGPARADANAGGMVSSGEGQVLECCDTRARTSGAAVTSRHYCQRDPPSPVGFRNGEWAHCYTTRFHRMFIDSQNLGRRGSRNVPELPLELRNVHKCPPP